MELLYLVVILALVGFLLWLVLTYVPMPDPFKKVITVVVVIVLVLWMARWLLGGGSLITLPR